jgi:uncharacterized alkaline shock family protein YloU
MPVDVIALVGPAGSGKSHRAGIIAHKHHCDLIIDDGLLILRDGKIIAGTSAKREDNKMAAVRRAIFHEDDHREEVRSALWGQKPKRVLVLGTSDDMIVKICDALDLPHPEQVIRIEDIATPAQIRLARRKRLEGKHVIPAPTFEVKKTFSGYMVDPLRFFLKRDQDVDAVPLEKSVVRPTFSSLGRFFIADTVIAAIATRTAEMIEGIGKVSKVVVESRREGVLVEMEIVLRYGFPLWDVLTNAQKAVAQQIEHMTALNVIEVNLDARRLMVE